MADDEQVEPVADVPKVCEAIVRLLQADPRRYRQFGVFWYGIKNILKRNGYTREQFYGLGHYTDVEAESHLPITTDAHLLALAIVEQQRRAAFEWDSSWCEFPDTGETHQLFDEDIGL